LTRAAVQTSKKLAMAVPRNPPRILTGKASNREFAQGAEREICAAALQKLLMIRHQYGTVHYNVKRFYENFLENSGKFGDWSLGHRQPG
jgi:hypothetical protein